MKSLETIDLNSIVESEQPSSSLGDKLLNCLRRDGIVGLTNHGLDPKAIFEQGFRFFSLPKEEKQKVERFVKSDANGYISLSAEKSLYYRNLVDYKECYDLLDLNECSGEDVMPAFTNQMKEFAVQCRELAVRIFAAMDLALNTGGALEAMHQDMLTKNGCSELRTLYYPPVPEGVGDDTVRCAAHTDYGTLTFLFQDEVGGLQRKTKSGNYVLIEPVQGQLTLMAGDMLEIYSAGQIRAVKHRVIIPTTTKERSSHRQSIAFFAQPDKNAIITPLYPNSGYKSVRGGDFFREKYDAIFPETHSKWYLSQEINSTSQNQLVSQETNKTS